MLTFFSSYLNLCEQEEDSKRIFCSRKITPKWGLKLFDIFHESMFYGVYNKVNKDEESVLLSVLATTYPAA